MNISIAVGNTLTYAFSVSARSCAFATERERFKVIWPALNSGDLRHRVTVLAETVTLNAAGTDTVLSPVISAWAKIEPMKGTDIIRSGQNITQLPVIVSMYYDASVQPKMRIQTLNGLYAIQAIRNVLELNAVMELTCLAIAGAE